MDQHPDRNPSPAPAIARAPAASRRAHWTPAKQRIFLTALHATGSVANAARAAGMSPSSAHRLRARLAGTPFDKAWAHVLGLHAGRLANPLSPEARGVRP